MNIGQFATTLLKSGKSAQETLGTVQKVFPGCKTSMKCIYYYASKAKIKLGSGAVADQKLLKAELAKLKKTA